MRSGWWYTAWMIGDVRAFLRTGTYLSFCEEVDGSVWLTVKIVNSPVDRKHARWRLFPDAGGDWSRDSVVI
jgi:hypothetical protein